MRQSGKMNVLRDIEAAMRREQSIGSLLAMLSSLLHVAEKAAEQAHMDPERMNEMAGYMAEIRYLLGQIRRESRQPAIVRESGNIAELCRELEGKVKELRNDRASVMK